MKHMKKYVGLVLAMIMAFAMTMTAFAANITITTGETGSEFAAYKLLNATDGGDGKIAYTVNETYRTVLQEVTSKTDDADIIAYIADLNDDDIRTFADDVYAKVKDMTADATTKTGTFENVAQGYYLIVETKVGTNEDSSTGSYSLVMLDTAGNENITIAAKEDTPTVVKKLKETNDSTGIITDWQDGADYDIGDSVPFQLTGTVSSKIADYETYYYEFHDTLSKGLTLDATYDTEDATVVKSGVTVKIDGTDVTSNFTITAVKNEDGTTSLSIKCNDIKSIDVVTVNASSKVVVEYNATLNKDANIGSAGNPNVVYLEYSNNPYDKGDGETKPETGKTPDDKVIVFTYQMVANKVDKDENPLSGAGFTLYKYDNAEGDYVQVGEQITGVTTFTFTGLDAGKYKLVETTVPNGYNQAADLYFTVEATYDTEAVEPALKTLVVKNKDGAVLSDPDDDDALFSATLDTGVVSTDVVNQSGTELPSTGGMGTTIFYVLGTILVLGAAIMLIAKKRMNK